MRQSLDLELPKAVQKVSDGFDDVVSKCSTNDDNLSKDNADFVAALAFRSIALIILQKGDDVRVIVQITHKHPIHLVESLTHQ